MCNEIKKELQSLKGNYIRISTINNNFYDGILQEVTDHIVILKENADCAFDWSVVLNHVDAWALFRDD